MIRRIIDFIRGAGAPTEGQSERDGFLSYSAEVHAVGWGLYHGLTSRPWRFKAKELPDRPDIQKEPHYYAGAYVAGTITQWVIMLTIGDASGAIAAVSALV